MAPAGSSEIGRPQTADETPIERTISTRGTYGDHFGADRRALVATRGRAKEGAGGRFLAEDAQRGGKQEGREYVLGHGGELGLLRLWWTK